MKYFWRLWCRVFGHAEPAVHIYPDNSLVIYCSRCLLIAAGKKK